MKMMDQRQPQVSAPPARPPASPPRRHVASRRPQELLPAPPVQPATAWQAWAQRCSPQRRCPTSIGTATLPAARMAASTRPKRSASTAPRASTICAPLATPTQLRRRPPLRRGRGQRRWPHFPRCHPSRAAWALARHAAGPRRAAWPRLAAPRHLAAARALTTASGAKWRCRAAPAASGRRGAVKASGRSRRRGHRSSRFRAGRGTRCMLARGRSAAVRLMVSGAGSTRRHATPPRGHPSSPCRTRRRFAPSPRAPS